MMRRHPSDAINVARVAPSGRLAFLKLMFMWVLFGEALGCLDMFEVLLDFDTKKCYNLYRLNFMGMLLT